MTVRVFIESKICRMKEQNMCEESSLSSHETRFERLRAAKAAADARVRDSPIPRCASMVGSSRSIQLQSKLAIDCLSLSACVDELGVPAMSSVVDLHEWLEALPSWLRESMKPFVDRCVRNEECVENLIKRNMSLQEEVEALEERIASEEKAIGPHAILLGELESVKKERDVLKEQLANVKVPHRRSDLSTSAESGSDPTTPVRSHTSIPPSCAFFSLSAKDNQQVDRSGEAELLDIYEKGFQKGGTIARGEQRVALSFNKVATGTGCLPSFEEAVRRPKGRRNGGLKEFEKISILDCPRAGNIKPCPPPPMAFTAIKPSCPSHSERPLSYGQISQPASNSKFSNPFHTAVYIQGSDASMNASEYRTLCEQQAHRDFIARSEAAATRSFYLPPPAILPKEKKSSWLDWFY